MTRYMMIYGGDYEEHPYASIEEMEQAIRDCHPETSYGYEDDEHMEREMSLHGEEFLEAMGAEWREVEYLMNPHTGTVQTREEWEADFESCTPEEWGGESFEDAELVEVVPNIPGEDGYDPDYGEWR